MYFTEEPVGGSYEIAAADSCSDPNAHCVNDICECNEGYYDVDRVIGNVFMPGIRFAYVHPDQMVQSA